MAVKHAPFEIDKMRLRRRAEEEARSRSRSPLIEGEIDKDVFPAHTADVYYHLVDARVCELFGCHKAYDAAERPFSVFCSNDCEVYYQEILQERRPYCANPGCHAFVVPPFLPFCCRLECSPARMKWYKEALQGRTPDERPTRTADFVQDPKRVGSVSARLTEEQQTSQQSYDSPPATDPWVPQAQRPHTIMETRFAEHELSRRRALGLAEDGVPGFRCYYKAPPPLPPRR